MSNAKYAKALEAALQVFWEKGYSATSIRDLEEALEMHPGSIYGMFKSKSDLFCQSLLLYTDQTLAKQQDSLSEAPSILEGLVRFIEKRHPNVDDTAPVPMCFLVKSQLETGINNDKVLQTIEDICRRNDAYFAELITEGIKAGEVSDTVDPQYMSHQLQVRLAGIAVVSMRADAKQVTDQAVADLSDWIRSFANE